MGSLTKKPLSSFSLTYYTWFLKMQLSRLAFPKMHRALIIWRIISSNPSCCCKRIVHLHSLLVALCCPSTGQWDSREFTSLWALLCCRWTSLKGYSGSHVNREASCMCSWFGLTFWAPVMLTKRTFLARFYPLSLGPEWNTWAKSKPNLHLGPRPSKLHPEAEWPRTSQ